jgi:DNA-binding NarL/FixJ family response regulator
LPVSHPHPSAVPGVACDAPGVLLAIDRGPARAALRAALGPLQLLVAGEASNADEAVAVALQTQPDACLVDASLPGDGVRTARLLATLLPTTAIVVIMRRESDREATAALGAGAVACLAWDAGPEVIGGAVRAALRGHATLPQSVVSAALARPVRGRAWIPQEDWDRLTPRQRETLAAALDGDATGDVAARLGLSEVTVRRHLSEALQRLGADGRDAFSVPAPVLHAEPARNDAGQLSAREREVLRLTADGLTNREIAGRLVVAETTVKNHIARITQRLGARSRTAAVALAIRRGEI